MERKYTTGRWYPSKESNFIMIASNNEEGEFVAKIPSHWNNANDNAKLIAASPEVLEALIALIPFASEWINDNHPAMQKAKKAIKKATE